jgi:hypothetical protein
MKLLVLDPGETTGWCLFRIEDAQMSFQTGNVVSTPSTELRKGLLRLQTFRPDEVVIELLPTQLNGKLRRIRQDIATFFPDPTQEINPGNWKPVTGNVPIPPKNGPPYSYTAHERDAYRLGMFYLRKRGSFLRDE